MDSSESTWCMFVYVCNLGWRTEVASWGTNKAPHKHKRFKANLSLGFLKVAVGIKPTTTLWFYQNDRRWTQKLKVMLESLIRGKNKMYRKLTKLNKSQSLNTDCHPKQKQQRVKWWCRLPENTRPSEQRNCSTSYKTSQLTDGSQLRGKITGEPDSLWLPETSRESLFAPGISDLSTTINIIISSSCTVE